VTAPTVAEATRLVAMLASIGVLVISLEWLVARSVWTGAGILSWPVIGQTYRDRSPAAVAVRDRLGRPAGTTCGLVAAMAAAVVVLLPGSDVVHTAGLATMTATMALVRLRFLPPGDGGDQMLVLVLAVLTIGSMVGTPLAHHLVLAFLAFQVVVAYVTAARSKLVVAAWRSGAVLRDVLATDTFGTPRLAAWLVQEGSVRRARALTWAVIGLELTLPLALVAPRPAAIAILAAGAVFHLSTGLVMGINRFLWPYLALYPAVLAINPF